MIGGDGNVLSARGNHWNGWLMIFNDGLIMASEWQIFDICSTHFRSENRSWLEIRERNGGFSSLPCLILPDGKPVNILFTRKIASYHSSHPVLIHPQMLGFFQAFHGRNMMIPAV